MTHHPTRSCPRCGIRRTVNPSRQTPGLCRDCRDVTRTLGEFTRWAA